MKAVLFDVDDTLYDQVIPFQKAYEELFKGSFELPIEELYKRSRYYSDEVFEATQRGEMSMEAMYIYRVQKAFESFGISVTDDEALEFQRLYAGNQKKLEISETMRTIIELCQKHEIMMGVITNGPSQHQWNKVKALKVMEFIREEYIFVSGDIGVAKPQIGIFQHVEKIMNLNPEETLFIGDTFQSDIVGAKEAGWKAIWLNRHHAEHPLGNLKADYCIHDEAELYKLVLNFITNEAI